MPLHLLVWSTQTAMSTLTCLVEMLSWEDLRPSEKGKLSWLYVPYLALGMYQVGFLARPSELTNKNSCHHGL